MPGSLYNSQNVVVGDAMLYLQPYDPDTPPVLPEDTVPLWTAYDAPWVYAGATDEGFKITFDSSTQDITIEEQSTPVKRSIESKTVQIEAALAEDTIQTMAWAYGGNVTTTAPGASVYGKSVLTLSDELVEFAAILECANKFGMARRIIVPRVMSAGSVETSFRRAADKRMYPITLGSVCPPNEIQIIELTAEPTGP